MMRRFLPILILVMAFSAIGAKPAAACPPIPGLQQLCEQITGGSLLDAVKSRVQIYVETMLYTLKLESEKKYSQSVALLEQKGGLAAAHRQDQREHMPAVAGVRCTLPSAIASALRSGAAAVPPSLQGANPTAPSQRTPAQKTADAKAAAGSRPPLPPAAAADGTPQPTGAALATLDTSGYDPETFQAKLSASRQKVLQDRRQNLPPALYGDANRGTLTDYNTRQSSYGPDQPVEQFRSADITATTLLLTKTFPPEKNNPQPKSFKVGETTVEVEPRTMKDAAEDFCKNLVDPTLLNPNRGQARSDDTARQAYAVQRAGWDARLSLASTICGDMVNIRTGISAGAKQQTGLYKVAKDYRDIACNASGITPDGKKYLNCTGSQFSNYEIMETLFARVMPSALGAKLLGAAGSPEMMGHLLAVDQMALLLNYRIYEMQERLNLIKAAQLAQLVENSKAGPGASASTR